MDFFFGLTVSEQSCRIWIDKQPQPLFPERRRVLLLFDSRADSLPQNSLMSTRCGSPLLLPKSLSTLPLSPSTHISFLSFSPFPAQLVPFYHSLLLFLSPLPSHLLSFWISSSGSLQKPFKWDVACVAGDTNKK